MSEFHSQIQNSYELRQMFELIQKDASTSNQGAAEMTLMDVSWVDHAHILVGHAHD